MHNNYFFLRQLSGELNEKLKDAALVECFSQQKDELILAFILKNRDDFYIQANLGSEFSSLNIPKNFHRAKRNTATLFEELYGSYVTEIIQAENERAFTLRFDNEYHLTFKLFGNRSNILLFHNDEAVKLFKNSLKNDWQLKLSQLSKKVEQSFDLFQQSKNPFKQFYFTLGPVAENYLREKGYEGLDVKGKYELIHKTIKELESPSSYYITRIKDKVVLSLLNFGNIISTHPSAIEAISAFYHAHYKYNFLEKLRQKILNDIEARIRSGEAYIHKSEKRLDEIRTSVPPEQLADILMANLHAISPGLLKVKLYDFYRDAEIEIKLKKDLSPQKYAELLYKKGKNRSLEINKLNETIHSKFEQLQQLDKERQEIEKAESHKDLEKWVKQYEQQQRRKEENIPVFKEYEMMGFKIFVGRNAENNDELTQRFAHKDDLWLHAKDVSGSHVVIQHQSGKSFPRPVVEKAAALAAWYSKRKNDSLCPVMYTLKKNVRKVKGTPKGSVKVEREEVIMVVPGEL